MLDSSDRSLLPLRWWRMHWVVCLSETYLFDIEKIVSVKLAMRASHEAMYFSDIVSCVRLT